MGRRSQPSPRALVFRQECQWRQADGQVDRHGHPCCATAFCCCCCCASISKAHCIIEEILPAAQTPRARLTRLFARIRRHPRLSGAFLATHGPTPGLATQIRHGCGHPAAIRQRPTTDLHCRLPSTIHYNPSCQYCLACSLTSSIVATHPQRLKRLVGPCE